MRDFWIEAEVSFVEIQDVDFRWKVIIALWQKPLLLQWLVMIVYTKKRVCFFVRVPRIHCYYFHSFGRLLPSSDTGDSAMAMLDFHSNLKEFCFFRGTFDVMGQKIVLFVMFIIMCLQLGRHLFLHASLGHRGNRKGGNRGENLREVCLVWNQVEVVLLDIGKE